MGYLTRIALFCMSCNLSCKRVLYSWLEKILSFSPFSLTSIFLVGFLFEIPPLWIVVRQHSNLTTSTATTANERVNSNDWSGVTKQNLCNWPTSTSNSEIWIKKLTWIINKNNIERLFLSKALASWFSRLKSSKAGKWQTRQWWYPRTMTVRSRRQTMVTE